MAACGGDGGNGNGNGNGGSNVGILTFTDELPTMYGFNKRRMFIINNNTNTSGNNWKNATQVIAHYIPSNTDDDDVNETDKSYIIRAPAKPMNLVNFGDELSSSSKKWTGSGVYAIYSDYPTEKILKDVTFSNGSVTVTWSEFSDL